MPSKVIFNEEDTQKMISMYLDGYQTQKAIGEQFGVSRYVVKRVLEENNIPIRKNTNKYRADYDCFEKIDSKGKAYWLGFIAADGCVYERAQNASLLINISRKDREHLEKFKDFMKTDARILDHIQTAGFSNNSEMSKIVINSVKMVNDLKDKGIVPRKSLVLEPPKIASEYDLAYILGYFDGDGSIYKDKNNEYHISIEGTKETLEWVNSILHISDNNYLNKRHEDDKNNYYIRCGGRKKPYEVMSLLYYNNCPYYLDRKYRIFKELEQSLT